MWTWTPTPTHCAQRLSADGAEAAHVVAIGDRSGARLIRTWAMPELNDGPITSHEVWVCHLGMVPYREALELQQHIRERRLVGELPDTLLLLEHPSVYTRGRRSTPGELSAHNPEGQIGQHGQHGRIDEEHPRVHGIDVVQTDRGGRITYHGPGQLVGYPIMRIHDIGAHLRAMESAIVRALADCDIEARSRCEEGPDYTGVWVEDRKIASIGVHVSRAITTHGFAVNVTNDLDPFSWVVACGLPDVTMTSLAHELPPGRAADPDDFRERMAHHFCDVHRRRPRLVSPRELGIDAAAPPPGQLAPDAPVSQPERLRGRTPRAHARRTPTTCADATPADPNPDTASLSSTHGAPV
jgi:lipoyl(octanoyl) transferase